MVMRKLVYFLVGLVGMTSSLQATPVELLAALGTNSSPVTSLKSLPQALQDEKQFALMAVLASAIVSVGETDTMIKTAANRYFAKPEADQISTLTDLLSSSPMDPKSGGATANCFSHGVSFVG